MRRRPGVVLPVWARLTLMTAAGFLALVVAAIFLTSALDRTAQRTARMKDLLDVVETAAAAHVAFGEMRYWMTDLSVSLLTRSERNGREARERLDGLLDALESREPETVAFIRAEADAYLDKALEAADAYTDDRRVIGNSLLAQARVHSEKVDEALNGLALRMNETAAAEQQAIVSRADLVSRIVLYGVLAALLIGGLAAALLLRSIVAPMRRLNDAMGAFMRGDYEAPLPPEGRDEIGTMARTLGLLRDVSKERARLEEAARRERRRIETAIETIPDGFVLYDADERILLANLRYHEIFPEAAEVAQPGATFREVLEAQAQAADLGGEPREAWIERRLTRHRAVEGFVDEVRHGDCWIRVAKRTTPDGGKVAVYTDITELKLRQDELEAARRSAESANAAKSDFLAAMSHELRTPLNAIIGYSEMLAEDAQDQGVEDFVPDLERISGAGRHLLMLINDVLDLSKIEAGKMEVYIETFDVAAAIEDVRGTVGPLMAKNGNTLILDLGDGLGEMESDQTKLRQNLFNLLSNAAKFTENGEVRLTARRETGEAGDRLVFAVSDTGIGMTAAQVSRLFEAFTQADASTTRNYGGTGLGLSITRSFCEMLGGTVSVESAPGVGSTFTMELPASAREHAERQAQAGPYVLVIDDEPAGRRMISAALLDAGFERREAESGPQGIEMARAARPLAIVLDIIMPKQDGWSVLRELKEDPELCDIPVVMASVLAERELGLALGAVEFLTKPVDAQRLAETIRAAGAGGTKVLVVDDDKTSRDLMRRILVKQGWMVEEAANGLRALDAMRRSKPHVVLLDLMMPEMDGFETLREMQEDPELRDIHVIVITARDLSGDELEWLGEHAASVVAKDANTRGRLVAALERQIPRPEGMRAL